MNLCFDWQPCTLEIACNCSLQQLVYNYIDQSHIYIIPVQYTFIVYTLYIHNNDMPSIPMSV